VAEAHEPLLVAGRLPQRLAEGDPDVLDRVVRVHLQVAIAADVDVDPRVGRERRQHMVEEADARPDPRAARAVEVQAEGDLRLPRLALDLCRPGLRAHARPLVASCPDSTSAVPSACRNVSFSCGVPTLTRRHCDSCGYEVTSRTSTPRRTSASNTAFGFADSSSSRKKFASEGRARTPGMSASRVSRRPRSSTSSCTPFASSFGSSSAAIAAICDSTLTLYGRRALFTSRTSSGDASR